MGHPQLPSYECLPFVDPPQQHGAEEDGPDASDDETNGEEGKRCAGDNEGSGQKHG